MTLFDKTNVLIETGYLLASSAARLPPDSTLYPRRGDMSCKAFHIGFCAMASRRTSAAWPLRGFSLGLEVRERLFGTAISGDEIYNGAHRHGFATAR